MEVVNGGNWERWKEGNSSDFVVETKRFSQKLTAGFWVIKEYHWSGIREISLSASHVNWLRDSLKRKCANPDSINRKVWRRIGECTAAVFDKANQWGKFISIVSKDPVKGNQFIIVPGGSAGSHWEQFTGWIGLAFQGEVVNQVVNQVRSNFGVTEDLVVRGARSYANVVTGVSSSPGVSTCARLEGEIAELRIKIMELTTAVRHLVDRDHQRRTVSSASTSGTTLVENTIDRPSEIAPDAITTIGEEETNLGNGSCRADVSHKQIRNEETNSAFSMEENRDDGEDDGGIPAEKMTEIKYLPDNFSVLAPQQMCTRADTDSIPQNHVVENILSGSSDNVAIVSTSDVGVLADAVSTHHMVECGSAAHVADVDVGAGNCMMDTCGQETAIVEEAVTGDNFTIPCFYLLS